MKKTVFTTALLVSMATTAFAASKATIMVRPESEIAGKTITIGNIATIKCSDRSLSQRIQSAEICPSPIPGRNRLISRNDIIIALRRARLDDRSMDILSPQQVSAMRSYKRVTGQSVFNAAKEYAGSSVSWPGTVDIQPTRLPNDMEAPVGEITLRVKPATTQLHKGQNNLSVEIVADGEVYKTVRTSLMIRLTMPVMVATKPITRLAEINESNIRIEQRDVTTMGSNVFTGELEAGQVAAVAIAEGSVIRKSWITQPPAVHAGDPVIVIVTSGAVKLAEKGTAVQDGLVGQLIKIKFEKDGREIRAKVSQTGLVTISADGGNQS